MRHGIRVKLLGFSATPDRQDKRDTSDAFPRGVHRVETLQLIRAKR